MAHDKYLSYTRYLKLDELLSLQRALSHEDGADVEHDELLFITIHQVFELWFKQLLHELDYAGARLAADDLPKASQVFKRVLTILKVLVGQIDVLETMTPLEFNAFRDRLDRASGLQSHQFREIECVLGLKDARVLARFPPDSAAGRAVAARLAAPTLWDTVLALLARRGYAVPAAALARDVTGPVAPSPEVQAVLAQVYRTDPPLMQLCERLVDLDEGLQEWRYRHVKMVQRTIGTKPGTGGTAGAEYLMGTLNRAAFPDLWAVRAAF